MVKLNNFLRKFIVLLLLMIMLLTPAVSATGDYSLPSVDEHITVLDDATTSITENITYDIDGSINGVYRNISLSGNQSIENISVETPGYYNTVEIINGTSSVEIKVWLYKDEAKTQKVSNEKVNVIYKYNFIKGVKIYNDIAELQYIVWGSGWDSDVGQLTTTIEIPGSFSDAESWFNPPDIVKNSTIENNTLKSIYTNVDSDQNIEQRILIPKSYFKSSENADIINKDAKEQIENDESDYYNKINIRNAIMELFAIIDLILVVLPIGIYLKYGREPKISYKAEYESDTPTDDSPVFVNAIATGNIGSINLNAFNATLLNLIAKGYYKVIIGNDDDTVIKRKNKDLSNLKLYEMDVINYLNKFEDKKGLISFLNIKNNANYDSFTRFLNGWEIDVNRDELTSSRISKLFNDHGSNVITLTTTFSLLFAVFVCIIVSFIGDGSEIYLPIITSVILIIESIIMYFLPNHIMGHFTPEGKEFYDKWHNFKKYINDYSLIKEYPPESIQVWGKYLVYATAMGCADNVTKNMKRYFKEINIPENVYLESDILAFSYFGGYYMMHSTFHDLNHTPTDLNSGSFGDIGDIGGGFGGGGGGVF